MFVTKILEKVFEKNRKTLAVPFIFCDFFSAFLKKRYIRIMRWSRVKTRFFLIGILEFCCIYIWNVVVRMKHFLFWFRDEFFRFVYKLILPIFAFYLHSSCYGKGLPCFQYNAIWLRRVYMIILYLPHSHTRPSKLNHYHEWTRRSSKNFC